MLTSLIDYARANNVPILRPQSSRLLKEQCISLQPKKILEIGTAIGYSGCLMLFSCDATLVTIEKDEKMFNLAKQNFEKFKLTSRVMQILGDAGEEIKKLKESYDLIFLDGPKGQYIKYLPLLQELLREGGVLFADDIYYHGLVLSNQPLPHKNRTMVNNLRAFISALETNPAFETQFINIEDGISISKKKKLVC